MSHTVVCRSDKTEVKVNLEVSATQLAGQLEPRTIAVVRRSLLPVPRAIQRALLSLPGEHRAVELSAVVGGSLFTPTSQPIGQKCFGLNQDRPDCAVEANGRSHTSVACSDSDVHVCARGRQEMHKTRSQTTRLVSCS